MYEWVKFHIRRTYIFAKSDASLPPVILNYINSLFIFALILAPPFTIILCNEVQVLKDIQIIQRRKGSTEFSWNFWKKETFEYYVSLMRKANGFLAASFEYFIIILTIPYVFFKPFIGKCCHHRWISFKILDTNRYVWCVLTFISNSKWSIFSKNCGHRRLVFYVFF